MNEIEKKLEEVLKEICVRYDLDKFQALAFLGGMIDYYLRDIIEG